MASSHLLELPRELRNLIYNFYLRCDYYAYEPNSGKLHTMDLEKIDLSLMYTCKQVATEMRGLPLQTNTVLFSTIHRKDLRSNVGKFGALSKRLQELKRSILDQSQSFITPALMSEIGIRYHKFLPILDRVKTYGSCESLTESYYGFPPSIYYDFVTICLGLLSRDSEYSPHICQNISESAVLALTLHKDPWTVPTSKDISDLEQINIQELDGFDFFEHTKYRLSATCGAIHFLQQLTKDTRSQFRRIILREDNMAVAYPESHSRGLIPFCIENPHLRIERHVDLWTNVFPNSSFSPYIIATTSLRRRESFVMNEMNANSISQAIALWVGEAMALPGLGMPTGSFSLVFNGDPIPEKSSQAFEIVRRDAVWQLAFEKSYQRSYLPREPIRWWHGQHPTIPWFQRRLSRAYVADMFPQTILDIINGNSIISCNFPIGPPWNDKEVGSLIDAHKEWSSDQWDQEFCKHDPESLDTDPPLPTWVEMLLNELEELPDIPVW